MKIETIDIAHFHFSGFTTNSDNSWVHIKELPYLSIVQSCVGSYGIQLNGEEEYRSGEGGFFIAPSRVTQHITHFPNPKQQIFTARYIFLDVVINQKYRADDIFDFPVTTKEETSRIFSKDFDEFEAAEDVCDRMCYLYRIIKHLLDTATEKRTFRNEEIRPLITFIEENYMDAITVRSMAEILKMSESNLYALFKKATGTSPIQYLNNHRLSVASSLLLQTGDSIKEIAERVGIADQFYFSKLFKAKFSVPPQEYRKKIF